MVGLTVEASMEMVSKESGLGTPEVALMAGVTYRQLDYWIRSGVVSPSVARVTGSGNQRKFAWEDVALVRVVGRMMEVDPTTDQGREAVRLIKANRRPDGTVDGFLVIDSKSVHYRTHPVEALNCLREMGGAALLLDLALLCGEEDA